LPTDALDWKVQSHSVRDYIGNYDFNTADVRDGKLILQRGGSG